VAPEINLFVHLLGFGLLVTPLFSGIILESQLRRAKDPQARNAIARSLRSVGILSPMAMLIMLITGIGNMQLSHYTMGNMPSWLAFKIVAFTLVVISGILFAIRSRKRSTLLKTITGTDIPEETSKKLSAYNRQITLAYIVLPLLVLIIVYLSITGVTGAQ
jgi:hypothetical protein